MKTTNNNYQSDKSIYAMLAHSDFQERSAYETAVYMLFILGAVFSIWQVAHQPVLQPTALRTQTTHVAQAAATVPAQGI